MHETILMKLATQHIQLLYYLILKISFILHGENSIGQIAKNEITTRVSFSGSIWTNASINSEDHYNYTLRIGTGDIYTMISVIIEFIGSDLHRVQKTIIP